MEYYAAIKRNEKLTTTWMSLEDMMPSESSQSQQTIYMTCPEQAHMKRQKAGKWLLKAEVMSGRTVEVAAEGDRVSFRNADYVLKVDRGSGYTTLNIAKTTEVNTSKW